MPPPPPPAPPPPPPPSSAGPPKLSRSAANDRSALLNDICSGTRLKKTVTNDRSKPLIGGSGGAKSSGSGAAGGGGGGGGAPQLAGLFAGGMPKLRPSGTSKPRTGPGGPAMIPPARRLPGVTTSTNGPPSLATTVSSSAVDAPTRPLPNPPVTAAPRNGTAAAGGDTAGGVRRLPAPPAAALKPSLSAGRLALASSSAAATSDLDSSRTPSWVRQQQHSAVGSGFHTLGRSSGAGFTSNSSSGRPQLSVGGAPAVPPISTKPAINGTQTLGRRTTMRPSLSPKPSAAALRPPTSRPPLPPVLRLSASSGNLTSASAANYQHESNGPLPPPPPPPRSPPGTPPQTPSHSVKPSQSFTNGTDGPASHRSAPGRPGPTSNGTRAPSTASALHRPPPNCKPPPPPPARTRNGPSSLPPPPPSHVVQSAKLPPPPPAPLPPTPPARNNSASNRNGGHNNGHVQPQARQTDVAGTDFGSRLAGRFRDINQLPPPDPFTNCPKIYPSRNPKVGGSMRRPAAPPPPPGPTPQLGY